MIGESISTLMKYYRERLDMSRGQLAIASSLSESFIHRLESGNRNPTQDAVERLAQALGLNPDEYDSLLDAAGFRVRDLRSLVVEPMVIDLDDLIAASPQDAADDLRAALRVLLRVGRDVFAESSAVA